MFDLSLDNVILLVHIIAGVLLVGSSAFAPQVAGALRRAPNVESLLMCLDFGRRTSAANPALAFVLLGTGIYLGSAGWWSTGWFWVAAVSWVVNSALAAGVVQRSAAALAKAAARVGHGPVTAELDAMRRARAWDIAEQVMLASDVGVLYAMFVKPSALEAMFVIAGIFAVVFGWHAARSARRAAAEHAAAAQP